MACSPAFSRCRDALNREGLYLAVAGGLGVSFQMAWTSMIGGKKVVAGAALERKEDLLFLSDLVAKPNNGFGRTRRASRRIREGSRVDTPRFATAGQGQSGGSRLSP